jgi:hypothetical protein
LYNLHCIFSPPIFVLTGVAGGTLMLHWTKVLTVSQLQSILLHQYFSGRFAGQILFSFFDGLWE